LLFRPRTSILCLKFLLAHADCDKNDLASVDLNANNTSGIQYISKRLNCFISLRYKDVFISWRITHFIVCKIPLMNIVFNSKHPIQTLFKELRLPFCSSKSIMQRVPIKTGCSDGCYNNFYENTAAKTRKS
jgi:hypothetical protein